MAGSNAPSDSSGPASSTNPALQRHLKLSPVGKAPAAVLPTGRPASPSPAPQQPTSPLAAHSDAGAAQKQLPLWDGKPVFTASLEPRPADTATLLGCLHRFTRQESLGPREQWICARYRRSILLQDKLSLWQPTRQQS